MSRMSYFRFLRTFAAALGALVLVSALLVADARPVSAHTIRIVWEINDDGSVTFYAANNHAMPTTPIGGLLINNVRYNFQASISNTTFLTLTPADGWDGSVTAPSPPATLERWQRVTVFGLSTGTYTLEATCDTTFECPWGSSSFVINLTFETPNEPPAAEIDAGPAVTLDEGDSITLDGSGSTDDGTITTYEWFVDGAPTPAATGQTFGFNALDGPATHTVTLVVTDDDGASGSASTQISVLNVSPTVIAGPAEQTILTNLTAMFSGSFTDPGESDGPFSAAWDFGDGASDSASVATSHVYTAPGVYTASLMVTDKDGGTGSASVTVMVLTPAEATEDLVDTIGGMSLEKGTANSLAAPLGEVDDLLEDGNAANDVGACGKLAAFLNQLAALEKKGKLSPEQAGQLRADAEAILQSIGC